MSNNNYPFQQQPQPPTQSTTTTNQVLLSNSQLADISLESDEDANLSNYFNFPSNQQQQLLSATLSPNTVASLQYTTTTNGNIYNNMQTPPLQYQQQQQQQQQNSSATMLSSQQLQAVAVARAMQSQQQPMLANKSSSSSPPILQQQQHDSSSHQSPSPPTTTTTTTQRLSGAAQFTVRVNSNLNALQQQQQASTSSTLPTTTTTTNNTAPTTTTGVASVPGGTIVIGNIKFPANPNLAMMNPSLAASSATTTTTTVTPPPLSSSSSSTTTDSHHSHLQQSPRGGLNIALHPSVVSASSTTNTTTTTTASLNSTSTSPTTAATAITTAATGSNDIFIAKKTTSATVTSPLQQEQASVVADHSELPPSTPTSSSNDKKSKKSKSSSSASTPTSSSSGATSPGGTPTGSSSSGNRVRSKTCKRWTEAQNRALREAVLKYGPRNWKRIASEIGGHFTADQCNQRWHRVSNPRIIKGDWTPEEDDLLFSLVQEFGESAWTKVAETIPGRTDIQCRHRFFQRKREIEASVVAKNSSSSGSSSMLGTMGVGSGTASSTSTFSVHSPSSANVSISSFSLSSATPSALLKKIGDQQQQGNSGDMMIDDEGDDTEDSLINNGGSSSLLSHEQLNNSAVDGSLLSAESPVPRRLSTHMSFPNTPSSKFSALLESSPHGQLIPSAMLLKQQQRQSLTSAADQQGSDAAVSNADIQQQTAPSMDIAEYRKFARQYANYGKRSGDSVTNDMSSFSYVEEEMFDDYEEQESIYEFVSAEKQQQEPSSPTPSNVTAPVMNAPHRSARMLDLDQDEEDDDAEMLEIDQDDGISTAPTGPSISLSTTSASTVAPSTVTSHQSSVDEDTKIHLLMSPSATGDRIIVSLFNSGDAALSSTHDKLSRKKGGKKQTTGSVNRMRGNLNVFIPWSEAEEVVLKKECLAYGDQMPDFATILTHHSMSFHPLHTPDVLKRHYLRLKAAKVDFTDSMSTITPSDKYSEEVLESEFGALREVKSKKDRFVKKDRKKKEPKEKKADKPKKERKKKEAEQAAPGPRVQKRKLKTLSDEDDDDIKSTVSGRFGAKKKRVSSKQTKKQKSSDTEDDDDQGQKVLFEALNILGTHNKVEATNAASDESDDVSMEKEEEETEVKPSVVQEDNAAMLLSFSAIATEPSAEDQMQDENGSTST